MTARVMACDPTAGLNGEKCAVDAAQAVAAEDSARSDSFDSLPRQGLHVSKTLESLKVGTHCLRAQMMTLSLELAAQQPMNCPLHKVWLQVVVRMVEGC